MPESNVSKKTIYLFYGEDNYSATRKCRHWQKEFEKKYGDMNIHLFEGKKTTFEEFSNAVDSLPFLSEKKLIILEHFLEDGKETEQKKLAEKIDDVADFCVIIFLEKEKPDGRLSLYKKIGKYGNIEEFHYLTGLKLTNWIKDELRKKGGVIEEKEAALLAETVGPDLWQMKQEIEKLHLYSLGQKIDAQAIEKLVNPNLNASIFKLTDNIGQKNYQQSLKTLHTLTESGEDIIRIFFMMIRQFRMLIQVTDCLEKGMNKNEILQKLKEHPYVISTVSAQSKNFDSSQLKKIYRALLNIDSDLKKGKIKISTGDTNEFSLALEKIILGIW